MNAAVIGWTFFGTLLLISMGITLNLAQDGSVTQGGKCSLCVVLWTLSASAACFYFAATWHP